MQVWFVQIIAPEKESQRRRKKRKKWLVLRWMCLGSGDVSSFLLGRYVFRTCKPLFLYFWCTCLMCFFPTTSPPALSYDWLSRTSVKSFLLYTRTFSPLSPSRLLICHDQILPLMYDGQYWNVLWHVNMGKCGSPGLPLGMGLGLGVSVKKGTMYCLDFIHMLHHLYAEQN